MLIVGDLHFGAKCTVKEYVNYQEQEFDNVIEYAKKHNIKNITFLGDIFNDRKSVYVQTIKLIKRKFEELSNLDIKFYIIIGNHDTFYKNTNDLNTPRELFGHLDSSKFIIIDDQPKEYIINNKRFSFVPWMSKENYNDTINYLKTSTADYCLGHFEINGFIMNNSNKCKSRFPASVFKEFKQVFSGHFHTKSKSKNILYTGSLCEIDWNDFDLGKGFYHLDISSGKIKFIKSNNRIFRKILIGKKFDFDKINITNSFLKIYINRKLTIKENTQLGDLISKNITYEIIDNTILDDIDQSDDIFKSEEFHEIVRTCVETQDMDERDKKDTIQLINEYYNEMKQESKI